MSLSRSAFLALIVCSPFLSWAQQSPAPAATEQPAASSPAAPQPSPMAPAPVNAQGRIHLDVVVTDKSGKPVSGLELKDFTLLDNNQPVPILSMRAFDNAAQMPRPPVEVILLIDAVNQPFHEVSFVRQEIEKFLLQNGGHLAQPVSLFVLTNDGVDVLFQPTLDGNALAGKIEKLDNKLRIIGRSAGAWGAIERVEFSIRMLTAIAIAETKNPGRKLLIWCGSGWPMLDSPHFQSTPNGQQQLFNSIVVLSTVLRQARISIYSISFGMPGGYTFLYEDYLKGVKKPEKADTTNLGLKVLAVQSGGAVFGPNNDMTAQINRCVRDAQAFYSLSFDPPHADHPNEYHDLKVLVGQPGLTARTRTGYYNQQ